MKRNFQFFLITVGSLLVFTGCGDKKNTVEELDSETTEQIIEDEVVDYASLSVSELEVLAYEDDAQAQYYLARIYEYGNEDVNQDFAKAIEWYEKAASFDYAEAYDALGYFYLTGTGVDKDYDLANEYFNQAVALGDINGNVGLARVIIEGFTPTELQIIELSPGIDATDDSNVESASTDDAVASEENVEISDENQENSSEDSKEETKAQDDSDGQEDSENLSDSTTKDGQLDEELSLENLKGDMSDDDYQALLDKATKAYTLIKEAADADDLDGVYFLGYVFENGIGTNVNITTAISCYELVVSAEDTDITDQYAINKSNVALGLIYMNDEALTDDEYEQQAAYDKAFEYFMEASDNNYAPAQYYVGQIYENGLGQDVDYEAALDYYEMAAALEYAPALNQIGYLYYNGYGVDVDFSTAVYYQKLAALQGYAPAQVNLGYLYENGYGVEQNLNTALSYYELAAEAGYEGADEAVVRVRAQLNEES